MNAALRALILEATGTARMIELDLADAAAGREPPDGPTGLGMAKARVGSLLREIGAAEAYAKRHGISLKPTIPRAPPADISIGEIPF